MIAAVGQKSSLELTGNSVMWNNARSLKRWSDIQTALNLLKKKMYANRSQSLKWSEEISCNLKPSVTFHLRSHLCTDAGSPGWGNYGFLSKYVLLHRWRCESCSLTRQWSHDFYITVIIWRGTEVYRVRMGQQCDKSESCRTAPVEQIKNQRKARTKRRAFPYDANQTSYW